MPATQESLLAIYRNLPESTQFLLQVFSVMYDEVKPENLLRALEKNPSFSPASREIILNFKRVCATLNKHKLLLGSAYKLRCNPLVAEVATRDLIEAGGWEQVVKLTQACQPLPNRSFGRQYFHTKSQAMRQARLFLYNGQVEDLMSLLMAGDGQWYGGVGAMEFQAEVVFNPPELAWCQRFPRPVMEVCLPLALEPTLVALEPALPIIQILEALWPAPETQPSAPSEGAAQPEPPEDAKGSKPSKQSKLQKSSAQAKQPEPTHTDSGRLALLWAEVLVWQGHWPEAEQVISDTQASMAKELQFLADGLLAFIALLRGDYSRSRQLYGAAYRQGKRNANTRIIWFTSLQSLGYPLVLLQLGTAEALSLASQLLESALKVPSSPHTVCALALHHVVEQQQGLIPATRPLALPEQEDLKEQCQEYLSLPSLPLFIWTLCRYWTEPKGNRSRLIDTFQEIVQRAKVAQLSWLAAEAAAALENCGVKGLLFQAQPWWEAKGGTPLVTLLQLQEPWEMSLAALAKLGQQGAEGNSLPVQGQRLVWVVDYDGPQSWQIYPKEQKLSAKGGWSRGRALAVKHLVDSKKTLDYLTPQDRQVLPYIEERYHDYYGYSRASGQYDVQPEAILALIGHPLVFLNDETMTPVELVGGEPELLVQVQADESLRLQLSPPLPPSGSVVVIRETPTRLKVVQLSDRHRHIATILGPENRLEVPAAAKERVLNAISAVAGIVTIHSDIGGVASDAETVAAVATPHVHLLPAGDGLRVSLLVRPFGEAGPYYAPGSGGLVVMGEVGGKRLQAQRDHDQERQGAERVIRACHPLAQDPQANYQWLLEDLEACLSVISTLQTLGDEVVVAWPEGETLKVRHQVSGAQFSLRVEQKRDWFQASGDLRISEDQVLDMQQLMRLLAETPSRFIPLGDGQFVELTETFRRRLDELRAFSESNGKGVRFHPLAVPALEDFIDDVGQLEADRAWKQHLKRLKTLDQFQPQLPSTLQAELRDYQIEGFSWLSRLAHWGVGACLADDMGLGKTLQALALILTRAPAGPTLVVAPTSVAPNWLSEAHKFAPTLNCLTLTTGSRAETIAHLQPFDLLICSYGLLQQEEVGDRLAEVEWETIVLDEAQAIKNSATKRSQAAMKLQGKFKLLTTGTPVENHLGELWNLFRFINPGLLGSLEQFNTRFAIPIERYQDKASRQTLKKLIQPFILRRTKSQVLSELPSRTEITLQVELSLEERSLYEALRREALEKLMDTSLDGGSKHLQVLAEIMRLRRACCHPQLVMPEMGLGSAKLEVLSDVLDELLENRHKALIFSQFVDHLAIIRHHLDSKKISYQYLDGSTPAAQRKKRVDAFQAGQGDVFLISLKAGGTGLNLTAADYVIHMDPWWNPAVEDQASDRAHRMGQQRPVTIYRLVTQGTIEEQIVALHQQKRDLADSLLDGTDVSGKVSTEDLLRLIQQI